MDNRFYLSPASDLIIGNQLAIMQKLIEIDSAVKAGGTHNVLGQRIEATEEALKNADRDC